MIFLKILNTAAIVLVTTTFSASNASTIQIQGNNQIPAEYYRIDEQADTKTSEDTIFQFDSNFFKLTKKAIFSLLKLTRVTDSFITPQEKYNRRVHFGRWINDPLDDTCQNTRAKVLVRDSIEPVAFRNGKLCTVDTGLWDDQYTGLKLNNARQIQVDHLVPLKHAWDTGASNWDFMSRCLYANFLENNYHLIPVFAHENMSKGDSGPDRYIPPNQIVTCGYIKNWLKVKLAWKLVLTDYELQAIQSIVFENNCSTSDLSISADELDETRRFMTSNMDFCSKNRRQ